jgi:hypothetical protein
MRREFRSSTAGVQLEKLSGRGPQGVKTVALILTFRSSERVVRHRSQKKKKKSETQKSEEEEEEEEEET